MRRRYDKSGLLALNPQAFFDWFLEPPERANTTAGEAAVVDIRGPLDHHAGWWCDSYDEILERVEAACSSSAATVVLRIDSPGGDASGCLETARAIRERCAAAGKKLVAFVEGQACSAAYALACSAEEISASEMSILGSIGVLNARYDGTEADKRWGVRVALTTSGARKADGHPSNPVTEAELVATQSIVDSLAGSFFQLVEDLRGLPVAQVEALEAGIFHGASAVEVGLADRVESFSALLARLAGAEPGGQNMATKYEEGRAALEEAAKGEGEDAEKAKKALAAMDEEEKPDAEGEGDKPDAEGGEGEGDETPDEDEDEEKPDASSSARRGGAVSARTAGAVGAAANKFATRIAKLERKQEASDRREFLATRPDLAPEFVKVLETKPLAEVKALVNAIPKPKASKLGQHAAAATPSATRGEGQGDGVASRLPPEQKAELDARMGLSAQKTGVVNTPHKLTLGGPVPTSAGKVA